MQCYCDCPLLVQAAHNPAYNLEEAYDTPITCYGGKMCIIEKYIAWGNIVPIVLKHALLKFLIIFVMWLYTYGFIFEYFYLKDGKTAADAS